MYDKGKGSPKMKKKYLFMLLSFLLIIFPIYQKAATAEVSATSTGASGFENPTYTLHSVDGTAVSTKTNPGQTTVLVFGKTTCTKTTTTLSNIAASEWIADDTIRVVFAECNFASQDETLSYSQKIDCEKIAFCYDESNIISQVMYDYATLFEDTARITLTTPFIVFIDGNNRVQSSLKGTQTAEQIKAEIDRLTDPMTPGDTTSPSPTPPEDLTGLENPEYIFRSIDEENISTRVVPTQTTLLVFGRPACSKTTSTLQDIAGSGWISREDIRVIFGEYDFASKDTVSQYSQQIGCDKITFCYDEENNAGGIRSAMFKYLSLFQEETTVNTPLIVLIDKNDRVQASWQGAQTADVLLEGLLQYAGPSETPSTTPQPPTLSNVSELKASSGEKKIKLSWKKTPKAEGYILYQYKSQKWVRTAAIPSKDNSYTVKKLRPGSDYRFAVKAYLTHNGSQVLSRSYTSVYTATRPAKVTFKVTAGRKKATLKWNKVKGAAGYTIYYKTSSKASWKTVKKVKGTSFTKKKLRSGKTYFFTVKAYKTYKGKTYTSDSKAKKVTIK